MPKLAISEFDALSGREQIRRLRKSGADVLRCYGIAAAQLKLLAHHRQTTFKVSDTRGEKFVLRFHRPSYRSAAAVELESRWLRSLRGHTDVVAPVPVATRSGEDVLAVSARELPNDLSCSLLKWVEGKRYFRRRGPGARVLREVGRIMATMHNHAERFEAPRQLPCPVWNWQRLFGQTNEVVVAAERRLLTAAERRLFRRVEERAKEAMDRLGTSRRVVGLIHADLIQANYLVHHGAVHVIDFAELGLGHFLYDMGITLYGLWGLDPEMKQRRAFLIGYREVRDLSPEHEKRIDVFTTARAMVQGRFVMTSNHPADQAIAPRYLQQVLACVRAWGS